MTEASDDRPDAARMMRAIDATWPPVEMTGLAGWTLRNGAGGGKRVSAASGFGEVKAAESAMRGMNQVPMFRLIEDDADLDRELQADGYAVVDPTMLYAAPAADLAGDRRHQGLTYLADCRPAMLDEIWWAGGIGPARLAIMDRVSGPHAWLMSRVGDKGCGAAFVGVDCRTTDGSAEGIAMIHAIEVLAEHRRNGAAALLIEAAARFARNRGALWLGLAVTEANGPARALYERLGMAVCGRYHYRVHPEGVTA